MTSRLASLCAAVLAATGCHPDDAAMDGCATQADCPDGDVCSADRICTPAPPGCVPSTCGAAQCGPRPDGCGHMVDCGTCPSEDHCTDHVKDQGETDVDCGGGCAACAVGQSCTVQHDCAAGTCDDGTCAAGTWSTAAAMPTARTMVGAVVVGTKIYAIGGFTTHGVTGVVEVYDPATDSWTTKAPMPTPRYGFGIAVGPDNLIYTIGGQYDDDHFTDGWSTVVEAYDPATNTWSAQPSLPNGRYTPAAATSHGKIYITGGLSLNPIELLGTALALTPGGGWTAVADPMTTARDQHAIATTSTGVIYAIGGYASNDLTAVEWYDPTSAGWHTAPPLPLAAKGLGAVAIDDKIYTVGGNGEVGVYGTTTFVYDLTTHSWGTAASMPDGRFGHATVRLGDRIYVIGGGGGTTASNTTADVAVFTP